MIIFALLVDGGLVGVFDWFGLVCLLWFLCFALLVCFSLWGGCLFAVDLLFGLFGCLVVWVVVVCVCCLWRMFVLELVVCLVCFWWLYCLNVLCFVVILIWLLLGCNLLRLFIWFWWLVYFVYFEVGALFGLVLMCDFNSVVWFCILHSLRYFVKLIVGLVIVVGLWLVWVIVYLSV